MLNLFGHRASVAYSGEEAIRLAPGYHVVILDLLMPGMNGFEVAERLRQSLPDTILVAMSGCGTPSDIQRSRKAGFDHHLLKPADPQALQALFARIAASVLA